MTENDTNSSENCNKYAISVIMPAFNSAKFIERTLNTILDQTASNFEVIVVDDGSTDNTCEVVEQIFRKSQRKDIQTRLIRMEHAGVSAARNLGLEKAQGEYVMFFDSDDLMNKDCLEKFMLTVKDTKYDAVICGVDAVYGNGKLKSKYSGFQHFQKELNGVDAVELFLSGKLYVCVENIIHKRSFLKSNNITFTPGLTRGEDVEFNTKSLYLSKRIGFISDSLITYVNMASSSSAEATRAFDYINSMVGIRKFLIEHHAPVKLIDIMDTKKKPEGYKSILQNQLYNGISISELIKISKREEFQSSFRTYKSISLYERFIFFILVHFPRLFFFSAKIKRKLSECKRA